MSKFRITFIGHASFLFESENGTIIYLDPWLDESPVAAIQRSDVDRADIVIATHGHNDHVQDAFEICRETGATFVGGYEMSLVAAANGIEDEDQIVALNPGGSTKVRDVAITLTQAHHSQSMSPELAFGPLPKGHYFRPDGGVNGVVLQFDSGITVYDTADTCVFSDMQLISQMYGPQIAILPVGGKYTMGIREGARATGFIRPDVVLPCHYGEALGQPADLDEFEKAVRFLCPATRVAALRPGASITYTPSSFMIE